LAGSVWGLVQTPLQQTDVGAVQAVPQVPQLLGLFEVLTQTPPQQVPGRPAAVVQPVLLAPEQVSRQTPLAHAVPFGQHLPLQQTVAQHLPSQQTCATPAAVVGQTWPQLPQLAGSLLVLVHAPAQQTSPAVVQHKPPQQACPDAQTFLHPPQ
jgi:hypothetical protein